MLLYYPWTQEIIFIFLFFLVVLHVSSLLSKYEVFVIDRSYLTKRSNCNSITGYKKVFHQEIHFKVISVTHLSVGKGNLLQD
jgi:hypothetical protein